MDINRSDALIEQVRDLDFVLTVKNGEFRLFMSLGELSPNRARLIPVDMNGLIAKSIVRDLIKETNYNAETNQI